MSHKVKIIKVEQRTEEWHAARLGRITGTGLKKILGTPRVREGYFYEILAERLSTESNSDESAMDRGIRLEKEAVEYYEAVTGSKVTQVGFVERSDNKWLGYSPDGLIEQNTGIYEKDIEVKSLSSANHLKAFITAKIPEEYHEQGISAFVVNDDLKERDFVFYDPRITTQPFFVITMKRSDHEQEIVEAKKQAEEFINTVNLAVEKII